MEHAPQTITSETSPVDAVWFAVTGGKFLLHQVRSEKYGDYVVVLDNNGKQIGDAHRIYADGYAVQTKPYAGYVPDRDIVWV
jgi:hypothetical protein